MTATYNEIGRDYNQTRRADPAIAASLIELLQPVNGSMYLDLACGTGNYTRIVAAAGGNWCGVDVSERMLQAARAHPSSIQWQLADAVGLPYPDNHFDGALCTLALHHFDDLPAALAEAGRVLNNGAAMVFFTATPEQMAGYWLQHYFPAMMAVSSESMPTLATIETALNAAGFEAVETRPFFVSADLQDLFLYSGKQRPAMYLQPEIRNGISSFHQHCDPAELRAGLAQLRADIDSGGIDEVIARYDSELGDYLFVRAVNARD